MYRVAAADGAGNGNAGSEATGNTTQASELARLLLYRAEGHRKTA